MDELRAVTAFNLTCARKIIDVFVSGAPADDRPRQALMAAAAFAGGGPRLQDLRLTAPAAHRAAKDAGSDAAAHAAMAAGDAAASAYLHPLADVAQVGHILRGPAHCVLALELRPHAALARTEAEDMMVYEANPTVVTVLKRYPPVEPSTRPVTQVMYNLDSRLRTYGTT